jgi:hypothetical protein
MCLLYVEICPEADALRFKEAGKPILKSRNGLDKKDGAGEGIFRRVRSPFEPLWRKAPPAVF